MKESDLQVYLTPLQIKKFNEKHEIKITKNAFNHNPNYTIKVDNNDMKHINNVKKGTLSSYDIKASALQATQSATKGGFLPLIPIIAALGAAAGGVSSIVNSVNNKRANDQLIAEKKRQNDILEKQNTEGKPITVNKITANEYAKASALQAAQSATKSLIGSGIHKVHKSPTIHVSGGYLKIPIVGKAISTNNKKIRVK